MRSGFTLVFALGAVLGSAGSALAHIDLDWPTDRGCSDQKVAPCGRSCDTRSSSVTALEPGSTITVRWTETINHSGHYRISFDDDGTDDFVSPTGDEDLMNPVPPVLLDGIADKNGGQYEAQVTLPDIECENCTLQLIQVMSVTPPYDAGDLYFRCADLSLRRGAGNGDAGPGPAIDAGPGPGPGPGTDAGGGGGGNGGGCSAGEDGSAGMAVLLLALGALLHRRALRC